MSNVSHEDGSSAKEAVETSAKAAAAKSAKATQVCKKECAHARAGKSFAEPGLQDELKSLAGASAAENFKAKFARWAVNS